MPDENSSGGESSASPADLQEFVDDTEKFSAVFKTTMEGLEDDWRSAAAGNDHVTFSAPFDEAEDVAKAWEARAEFVGSVRQAFIDADSYDPDDPSAVLTVPNSAIDEILDRSAEKLIEIGVDPDDAEKIAAGAPELYDAVVDGYISVDAAVKVAELPVSAQRNVLSTGLDSDEITEVLDGDHGQTAKEALTEGHGYRVRLLMLDEETRASVHVSDTLETILENDEDHVSFDDLQTRIGGERAAIVADFQANGMSYDEAQAAYDDVLASVEFLAENKDARMALDGGADPDSKPGDPDADNRYGVADAQARAIQLLEDDETSNGQRLWQRAMQAQMGTPTIFVLETEEGARDAQALIEEHTSEPGGNHYQPRPGGVDTDDIVAEIQAIRRYDPEAAAALEIAVARELDGEDRAAFIEQMATQTRLEATTNAVLSQSIDSDVEIDQNQVDAEVERILDETTWEQSPNGPYGNPRPKQGFNASEAEYQINELAKTNPALAIIVKQQLDAQLEPEHVAEFNRLIADSGFVDDINSVGNHPMQGAEGAAKGFVNGFIFMGNALIPDADREFGDFGVGEKIPYFELENSAQRGGANMGAIAELALAGKGLIKIGGKWFIRNGDNITEIAIKNGDTLPHPTGPRILLPDGTVKPPPAGTPTPKVSPEAQAYADGINSNRGNWNWDEVAPNLTRTQRNKIKAEAIRAGIVYRVPKKPTGHPDFVASGVVHTVDQLPKRLWGKSIRRQEKYLDARLPGGQRPAGYTWHHSELDGRMELVETGVHRANGHSGGVSKGAWSHGSR